MNISTFLRPRHWFRLSALLLLWSGLALRPQAARASHLLAGDIRVTFDTTANAPVNSLRVFFRMIIYTNNKSNAKATTATVFFGDGTSTCKEGLARTGNERPFPLNPDVSVNVFYFEHTYPTTGPYTVSYIGENRNDGVRNMSNSSSQSFYISTFFQLDPTLGRNRSPVLRTPAVDAGAIGQVFLHNPGAYDADGDSLSYALIASQQVPGGVDFTVGPPCSNATGNNTPKPVACTNYHFPNDPVISAPTVPVQVAYTGTPAGVPGNPAIFEIDPVTGQITWNAPVLAGPYNFAIEIQEWRRYPRRRRLRIGTVVRDMQVNIVASANLPPKLVLPPNLCVVAGETVRAQVTATDGIGAGTTQTPVTLTAYSGILPPATFVQTQTGPPTAVGNFTWNTTCSNVANRPYLVVFKAQDSPSGGGAANPPLVDQQPWLITVVGPPPANLRATPTAGAGGNPNSITLNWNTYTCANAEFINIYRKVDRSTFVPSACVTGIPASAGYEFVARVPASATSFTDNNVDLATNTVRGLNRGTTYCYRIYADFPLPALGQSIASNEVCAQIPGRAAMLTKVDVLSTSATTGQIQVCWTKPLTGTNTPFDGTLSYRLERAEGLNPAATAYGLVANIPSLADTCYTDTNLNTEGRQYTYRLTFVRSFPAPTPAITETSPVASSVRVSALPRNAGTAATVTWTYSVPWDNTAQPTRVFRRGPTGGFVQVGTATSTATGGTFADNDPTLVKDQRYCYYVQTVGRYAGFPFLSNLPNRSQEFCVTLSAPPCPPRLVLLPTNCDSLANLQEFPRANDKYVNELRWRLNVQPTCDAAVASYRVFYRPTPTGPFTQIATTTGTSYQDRNRSFSAGCYAVQAVGASGLVSDTSNVACQENCLFFKLPNIFTPNGDGQNAVFRPKNYSPLRQVHFQAYNRWGVKVFENTTTAADGIFINWNGGGPRAENSASTGRVPDGVYFYLAEVEFDDSANTKRTYKGWVEIVR